MFARRRPLLRAAAVGGGAYLAGKARQRRLGEREQREAYQDARVSDHEQSQAAGTPGSQPAAAGQSAGSVPEQLGQLTELHDKGALTDAEFATAKSRLLEL
jgi:Short C-terminal domain